MSRTEDLLLLYVERDLVKMAAQRNPMFAEDVEVAKTASEVYGMENAKLAREVHASVRDRLNAALDAARQMGSRGYGKAKETGSRAYNKAKETGSRAYNKAKETGSRAYDKAKETGSRAYGKAKEMGNQARDKAKEYGSKAYKSVNDNKVPLSIGAGLGAGAGAAGTYAYNKRKED